VLIAYNKFATNQSTGKKAPYWTHANTHTRTFEYIHTFLTSTHTQMHTHLFFDTPTFFSETHALCKKHTLSTNLSFKTYTYTGASTGVAIARRSKTQHRCGGSEEELSRSLRGGSGAQFPTWIPSSCLPRLRKRTHSFV